MGACFSVKIVVSKMIMKLGKKSYLDNFPLTLPPFILCESPNLLLIKKGFLAEPLGLPREDAGFMQLEL